MGTGHSRRFAVQFCHHLNIILQTLKGEDPQEQLGSVKLDGNLEQFYLIINERMAFPRCYSQIFCAVPCCTERRSEECSSVQCNYNNHAISRAATYMVTSCTVNTRYTRYTRYSTHFCCKNIPARCNLHCIFPCPLSSFWRVSAGCEMPVSISLRDVIVRGLRF